MAPVDFIQRDVEIDVARTLAVTRALSQHHFRWQRCNHACHRIHKLDADAVHPPETAGIQAAGRTIPSHPLRACAVRDLPPDFRLVDGRYPNFVVGDIRDPGSIRRPGGTPDFGVGGDRRPCLSNRLPVTDLDTFNAISAALARDKGDS